MTRKEEIQLDKAKAEMLVLLGKRIQSLREGLGISQVDLAGKVLGRFDTANVYRIESGRTNPTAFKLYRIDLALEVSISELTEIEDVKIDI